MLVRGVLLVGAAVVSLAVAPGTAFAAGTTTTSVLGAGSSGSNPLAPGIPQSTVPSVSTTTAPTIIQTTSTPGSSGLSSGAAITIVAGAVALLSGISFLIWRDARRRAPVRRREAALAAGGRSGSKGRAKPRKLSPAERRRRKRGRAR